MKLNDETKQTLEVVGFSLWCGVGLIGADALVKGNLWGAVVIACYALVILVY